MTCFLITCNLKGSDYTRLLETMHAWNAESMLPSSWIANVGGTVSDVLAVMRSLVNDSDGVAIIEIKRDAEWAALGTRPDSMDMLQRNTDGADVGTTYVGKIVPPD